MLEPIEKLEISYEFYPINESLEPIDLPKLKKNEAFLYTNYFGLKQKCVKHLFEVYGNQLIVYNAQAFFMEPLQGIDTFYSARKFFGVPDGAYLYIDKKTDKVFDQDISYERVSHLLKRIDVSAEFGFLDFRRNDEALCNQEMKKMSKLTDMILSGIDYEDVKRKREENYAFLDKALKDSNQLHLQLDDEFVPMVYPYLTDDALLRQKLIENKVFVATYWPNIKVWTTESMFERKLMERLIPLPCDQRYRTTDLLRIIETIK